MRANVPTAKPYLDAIENSVSPTLTAWRVTEVNAEPFFVKIKLSFWPGFMVYGGISEFVFASSRTFKSYRQAIE